MPGYQRTAWVDRVTPVSAANLNNMEAGIWLANGLLADFCLDANINIASGPTSPFDGVSYGLSPVGLRFLLIGQTDSTQNGLWQHNGAGNAMTRPAEFPAGLVLLDGLRIGVKQGKAYGGAILTLNNGRIDAALTATVGTNGLAFLRPPSPAVVTALPTNPADGQECNYLADATNGVVWNLVYRSTSGKWHFVGGPPLYAEVANGGNGIVSTNYGDLGTPGPSLTVPVLGAYLLEYGYMGYFSNNSNADPRAVGSPSIAGAAPADQNAIYMGPGFAVPAGQQHNQHAARALKQSAIAAGAVVAMKFRYENQSPALVDNRFLKITPITVG